MIKRIFLFFLIFDFGLFFLLSGLFGENGYFVNKDLEKQISDIELEIAELDNQIEILNNKLIELSTVDAIRESAMRYGYKVEGDEIIIFKNSSVQDVVESVSPVNQEQKYFSPISVGITICISSGISLLFSLIMFFVLVLKEKENDSEQEQSGNNSNYLFSN